MNTTIYYFSATGNSLRIARIIAEGTNAQLLSMPVQKETACKSQRIGLVFPTYFWGVPRTVAEFINGLRVESKSPYIFAVSTCGGLHGGVLGHTAELLGNRGLHLDYGLAVTSVANYVEEYNPMTGSADRKLRAADDMAKKAAADITSGRRNGPFRRFVWDRMFYKIYTDVKLDKDAGFHVDPSCIHCGVCQRICPNQNIVLNNGVPEFKHHCEHCVACINCCPKHAIQWKKATQKRRRYRNPQVSVDDIINGMGNHTTQKQP